ncbi:MAG: radical SAM family heme chaperone HemW [Desulfuromonadales bacterium]|nr:radical SAM family heme chaperone HemW [Desulfuromonadales bacterium]
MEENGLSIYIHIPFCLKKCSYCDFNSVVASEVDIESYIHLVTEEMRQYHELIPLTRAKTLYFGGGTPSLLSQTQVLKIIEAARTFYCLTDDAEITLEVNPGTITRDSLKGYKEAGVNRLSIGVQSLDDGILEFLGRLHKADDGKKAVDYAYKAGFNNIGVDLIHSIPGQFLKNWEKTLEEAVNLGVPHISAYSLTVEPGTPLDASVDTGMVTLLDDDLSADMFELTEEVLERAGFEHYEISNFCKSGYSSKHNRVYWTRGNYLGFGAGGHSFLDITGYGARWENLQDIVKYKESVIKTDRPQIFPVSEKNAMGEFFFLGLRLLSGVNLDRFRERFNTGAETLFGSAMDKFYSLGLLQKQGANIKLTKKGVSLANQVLMEFV